jgi:hypothetical protein
MKRHRYRLESIPGLPAAATEWSPTGLPQPKPAQGWLALDGAALGPLFNDHATTPQEEQ